MINPNLSPYDLGFAINDPERSAALLEGLVDATSLASVLEALARVCESKSLHLEETWGDYQASSEWMDAELTVDRARYQLPKFPGIRP